MTIRFHLEKISHNIYDRYEVSNIQENGSRQCCGYLDLTEPEFEALKFLLLEGEKAYQDGEVVVTFGDHSVKHAFLEGVE